MTDLRSILQSICDQTIRSTDYDFCSISIYNEESDKLELTAFSPQTNLPYPYPSISRQKYDDYIQSYGSPNVFEDINSLSNEPELEILHYFGVRTVVVFPLKNNGELLGSLAIASIGDVRLPNHHDLHFLRNLSTETEVSLSKGLLIEKLTDSSKRMQILTKKLIEVQEEERRSLARELHDQIGQSLTSLRLNLDLITHTIQGHPESCEIVQGYIDNASEITVRLLERIREMSLDLRPTMLDDFGLVPALLAFFDRQAAQANIQVDFKHSGVDRRYHSNLETAAFRIIQEGLTNAAKHSGTQLVSVRLWADEHFLRLRVEDSGNGFDLQKAIHSGKTSGLSGMYERAASLGGSLEIETEPKHGTCITAGLSIRQEEM